MYHYTQNFTKQKLSLNNELKDLTKDTLSLIVYSVHLGNAFYQQNKCSNILSSILFKYKTNGHITKQEMDLAKQCYYTSCHYQKQAKDFGFKTITTLISSSLDLINLVYKSNTNISTHHSSSFKDF